MNSSRRFLRADRAPRLFLATATAAALLAGCEQRSTTVTTPTGSVTTTTLEPTPSARRELDEAAAAASAVLSRAGPAASRVLEQAKDAAADAASSVRESASSGALARAGASASAALGRAGDAATDAAITAKVKTALLADSRVMGTRIEVETKDRVVTLSTGAEAEPGLSTAVEIARRVEGVGSVESRRAAK